MLKSKFLFILFLLLLLTANTDLIAQCSMCKAIAESSADGGSGIADGLNLGIVYLMAFPYLLIGAVGFSIYRMKKKASITKD